MIQKQRLTIPFRADQNPSKAICESSDQDIAREANIGTITIEQVLNDRARKDRLCREEQQGRKDSRIWQPAMQASPRRPRSTYFDALFTEPASSFWAPDHPECIPEAACRAWKSYIREARRQVWALAFESSEWSRRKRAKAAAKRSHSIASRRPTRDWLRFGPSPDRLVCVNGVTTPSGRSHASMKVAEISDYGGRSDED